MSAEIRRIGIASRSLRECSSRALALISESCLNWAAATQLLLLFLPGHKLWFKQRISNSVTNDGPKEANKASPAAHWHTHTKRSRQHGASRSNWRWIHSNFRTVLPDEKKESNLETRDHAAAGQITHSFFVPSLCAGTLSKFSMHINPPFTLIYAPPFSQHDFFFSPHLRRLSWELLFKLLSFCASQSHLHFASGKTTIAFSSRSRVGLVVVVMREGGKKKYSANNCSSSPLKGPLKRHSDFALLFAGQTRLLTFHFPRVGMRNRMYNENQLKYWTNQAFYISKTRHLLLKIDLKIMAL